jgi:hypothetical protein
MSAPVAARAFVVSAMKRHKVDEDDNGRTRYAERGMRGTVRIAHNLANPFSIVWSNGAWGFYTDAEYRRLTRPTRKLRADWLKARA